MNAVHPMPRGPASLCAAFGLALSFAGFAVPAQDHSMHRTPSVPAPQDPHAGHRPAKKPAPGKADAAPEESESAEAVDHAAMGHAPSAKPAGPVDRTQTDHAPVTPIPPITEADRAAAFPDVAGHAVHDDAVNYLVLFNQLEWQNADESNALSWDAKAWIGGDLNRLWLRAEGEREGGRTGESEAHVLYGRSVARWWDVVAGIRQDFRPGPSQSWAAIGVQGLAPYKFEVEATAYLGESGQTAARLEAEYELLLTNRLILQPLVELNFHGEDDPRRGVGSGLSTAEAGLRLRYEVRREFAPYVGITWSRAYGKTADFAELDGEDVDDTRLVAGLRIWF